MDELRLDGNALGGALEESFGVDLTGVRGACAHCGRVAAVGSQHLYRYPRAPGAVLRCAGCGAVLLVLVARSDGQRLTLRGLRWIEPPGAVPGEGRPSSSPSW
jgi:hypothetical protein